MSDALSGKVSLSRAFWLYGVGVSVAYTVAAGFIDVENRVAIAVYGAVGLALGLVQTLILWRSAKNSPSKVLGRLVRILVIAGLLMIPMMIYLLFVGSVALLPPELR